MYYCRLEIYFTMSETIYTCSICWNVNDFEQKEIVTLSCGHSFHFNCIGAWLSNHSWCPLCKENFSRQTKPLFTFGCFMVTTMPIRRRKQLRPRRIPCRRRPLVLRESSTNGPPSENIIQHQPFRSQPPEKCSACNQPMDQTMILTCGHRYHPRCAVLLLEPDDMSIALMIQLNTHVSECRNCWKLCESDRRWIEHYAGSKQ